MKRILKLLLILLAIHIFSFDVAADNNEISFDLIHKDLPGEIVKYVDAEYDIELIIKDVINNGLQFSIKTFGTVIMICIVTVLVKSLSPNSNKGAYTFNFISTYGCAIVVYSLIYSQIEIISTYAARLSELMSGFMIFSNSVFLFCGHVTTAATSCAWLQLIMTLVNNSVTTYMLPILKILCGSSLADVTLCNGRLSSFFQLIKNIFMWVCSTIITLITTAMTVQTSLSKVTDTAGVQSIKFAATQAFPIVGGLVSESVRSVAGAANSAKNAGGAIVLLLIAIIALFPLSSLIGIKIGLSFAQIGCDMLGCNEITVVINKSFSLINFMLAMVGLLASAFALSAISFMTQNLNISS